MKLIFLMYRRFKIIIFILLSILTIQLALPLIFSWTSDSPSNATEVSKPTVSSRKTPVRGKSGNKIDLSHLPFKANCAIKTKNAASAIERAKSIQCKEELVNITCLMQKNQLYPRDLLSKCPHKEFMRFSPKPEEPFASDVKPIRIAFILTLSGRSLRQVKRLMSLIYDKDHFYWIHVDSRENYLFGHLKEITDKLTNVRMTNNRFATIWGGASLLKVLVNAFSDLLAWSPEWDYAINLSESDFPIKPLIRLESFLLANRGFNFVKSHGQDGNKFIKKQGLDRTFHECENRMWKLGKRKLLPSIKWDGGSDWIAITRDFAYFVAKSNDSLVNGLLQIYSYTLLPAESFFHTVLHNSQFCHKVIDNNLHMTNWKRKTGCRCQHKHIVDWCGCSPNDYSMSDWAIIASSINKAVYFARKFEPVVSLSIINKLESWILNQNFTRRSFTTSSFNSYWQNVFDFQFDSLEQAQLTFYTALQLVSLSHLNHLCHLQNEKNYYSNYDSSEMYLDLLEFTALDSVNFYFTNDAFTGILIGMNVTIDGDDGSALGHTDDDQQKELYNLIKRRRSPSSPNVTSAYIEAFFKPKYTFAHEPKVHLNSQITLTKMTVCSNLDVKELIFRNFPCILSSRTSSKLAVAIDWQIDVDESRNLFTTGNVTALLEWIHPNGSVRQSMATSYNLSQVLEGDSDSTMASELSHRAIRLFFNPNINFTLVPGLWKLRVKYFPYFIQETSSSHSKFEVAQVSFMSLPQISPREKQSIKYGTGSKKSLNLLKDWFTLFFDVNENAYKFTDDDGEGEAIVYSFKKMLYQTWKLEQICFTRLDNATFTSSDGTASLNRVNDANANASEFIAMDESIEDLSRGNQEEGEVLDDKNDNPYVTSDAFYSKCLSQAFTKSEMIKSCELVSWSSFSSDLKSNFANE